MLRLPDIGRKKIKRPDMIAASRRGHKPEAAKLKGRFSRRQKGMGLVQTRIRFAGNCVILFQ
ncbi:hypothetical protein CSC3H3_12955 [Thalassospira marina]|uniref:Uncharacterized protein n=1 Tax=Thalassospira marina TaxID=2048283 RepID=A0A2N3KB19_9PROT|nr:hypothetical protein CSC3H3_12955 [Thalassospira marina]PKR47759.1 hypothetical protein COO20_25510 [Thalassospira marina]